MDEKMRNSRLNWTSQEDDIIKTVYERQESKSWVKISKVLKKQNRNFQKSPKQCRERYMNFLKHSENGSDKNQWTIEEQALLIEKFNVHGSKWVKIAQVFPQKSENCIKNKFYGSLRKVLRKINRIQKEYRPTPHKNIKYESVLKLFQTTNTENPPKITTKFHQKLQTFLTLKNDLLNLTLNIDKQDTEIYLQIAQRLHKFVSQSRFMYLNSNKNKQKYQKIMINQSGKQSDVIKSSKNTLKASLQIKRAQLQEQIDQEYSEYDQQISQQQYQQNNDYKENENNKSDQVQKWIQQKYACYSQNIKDIFTLQEKWELLRTKTESEHDIQYTFL